MQTKKKIAFGLVGAYGAALWALSFALLHLVWAAGWYAGLPADEARAAFQRPWFYAYNLVAAGMCAVAAPLALALARLPRPERRMSARLLAIFSWSATVILSLRGIAGVVKFAYLQIAGNDIAKPEFLWDFWFCLGGLLFGLASWNLRRISNVKN